MIALAVAIILALVVFWLLAHVSVILAAIVAALVILAAVPSVTGRGWPW